MKKLLILALSSGLVLAACGKDDSTEVNTDEKTNKEAETTVNTSADLMKFYMSISNTINETDADLNAYEKTLSAEGDVEPLKETALASAENTAAAVEGLEIPATLTEYEEALTTAVTQLTEIYNVKAAAITEGDAAKIEESNTQFQAVDEELNAILEEAGLFPSSIYNEVTK